MRATVVGMGLALLELAGSSVTYAQTPDGTAIYQSACAACHGDDGRGRSAPEVGFDTPLPDFTDCDFAVREQDGDWSAIIHRGGPIRSFNQMMPAFGEALSDEEIAAAITHLRGFCTDAHWPRGELNVPRAIYTEKAFPEDEAVITTTLVTDGPDSLTHEFVWEQRFGTVNQIELSVPITRADLGEQGWKSGTGDLGVGVKHALRHSLERGSILAVGGEIVLPTGDEAKGFGAGTTILEAFAMYDKLLPNDSFLQLQGIVEFPRGAELDDEVTVRAAYGRTWTSDRPFGRAWTPIVELLAARPLEDGADTEWDVAPQLQVSLSKRQHIQASAGVRLPLNGRSDRTPEYVFYLLWDWFDGGVRQGW